MAIYKVGDIVDAYCTRCKLIVDASVAAVVGDEIVSVVCRTCDEKQRYRASKPEKVADRGRNLRVVDVVPRTRGRSRSTRSRSRSLARRPGPRLGGAPAKPPKKRVPRAEEEPDVKALRERWDEETADVPSSEGRPHREWDYYEPGDYILHKRHGMGVVQERADDGTLKILFREGFVELPSSAELPTPRDDED